MTTFLIFILVPVVIGAFFIGNMLSYKSDEKLIKDYFENRSTSVSEIKELSLYQFKHKEELKVIMDKNKLVNSILVAGHGTATMRNTYLITTSDNKVFKILVVNSVLFFIKPQLHLFEQND